MLHGLTKYRNNEKFSEFFELVQEESRDRCDPPIMLRQRQMPKLLNDGAAGHVFQFVDNLYRKEYYDEIDNVKRELERRFT